MNVCMQIQCVYANHFRMKNIKRWTCAKIACNCNYTLVMNIKYYCKNLKNIILQIFNDVSTISLFKYQFTNKKNRSDL